MEQTKALNALEPFLALTKSASSPRAAVDLITRATSAPNTFVFTELLDAPQIRALDGSSDHGAYLQLLSIFCYGTYDLYTRTPNLPPLSEAQTLKLRQLSLLTLSRDPRNLTYQNLISLLGLEGGRALEKLVISAIYAGLLSGTLDPHNQRVCISSISPLRDVSPGSVSSLIATLHEWSDRCSATLLILESQIESIRADALRRRKTEREWEMNLEKMITEEGDPVSNDAPKKSAGRRGDNMKRGFLNRGPGAVDDGEMDIDEEEEEVEKRGTGTRSLKKRGLGGLSFKH